MIYQTERIYVRKLVPDDFQETCKILQDPQVMYAYEHAFSREEVEDWLQRQYDRYEKDGFGLWAVILKETGAFIGQCGLTMQEWNHTQVPEIGYLFQKAYWGRGLALEAAKGCKKYAFEVKHFPTVYSIIRENNVASQKVALRNGMTVRGKLVKYYYGMEMPHLVFGVDNSPQKDENG